MTPVRVFLPNLFITGMCKISKHVHLRTVMLLRRHPSLLYFKVPEITIDGISFKESAFLGCALWALCWLLHNLDSRPFSVSWHLLLSAHRAFSLHCLIPAYSFKMLVGQENVQFQSFMGLKNNSLHLY